MNEWLTYLPQVGNLVHLVEWLLVFNVVLTGAVILLAFRATEYKNRIEDLENELNAAIRDRLKDIEDL